MPVLEGPVNGVVTVPDFAAFLGRATERVHAYQSALNALDGKLGDGDIGVSVSTAFDAIDRASFPADFGMALMQCAQAVTRSGGSSFCTLLAAGLMAAAKVAKGRESVRYADLAELLGSAIERMSALGKSSRGDKTVLDALDAARVAVERNGEPARMKAEIVRAVDEAMERMRELPCKQGRARIFAEKSVGLDDPGMLAIAVIVGAL